MRSKKQSSDINEDRRIVVVLNETTISWYGVENGADCIELIHTQSLTGGSLFIPSSLTNREGDMHTVEVLVDGFLDDLDRIKLLDEGASYLKYLRTVRTLWQLKRDYADSEVIRLPGSAYPNVACVLHSEISAPHCVALQNLQDSGVVITHLVSSTQVFRLSNRYEEPYLLKLPNGALESKYMLLQGKLILSMRVVKNEDSYSVKDAVANYLEFDVLQSNKVLLAAPEYNDDGASDPVSHELFLVSTYIAASSRLLFVSSFSDHSKSSQNVSKHALQPGTRNSRLRAFLCRFKSVLRFSRTQLKISSRWKHYHVSKALLSRYELLEPSRIVLRSYARLRMLRNITITLAFITAFAVLITLVKSVSHIRALNLLKKEQQNVEATIQNTQIGLSSLIEKPLVAFDVLNQVQSYTDSFKYSPVSVLTLIASSLKEHPSIQLEYIFWRNIPKGKDVGSVVATVADSFARDAPNGYSFNDEKLHVTIAGTLINSDSLRKKQLVFDSYTEDLLRNSSIRELSVLISPVGSAQSSEFVREDIEDFRISFMASTP